MQKRQGIDYSAMDKNEKKQLWLAAIKLPMYSVAIMPVLLAAGMRIGEKAAVRFDQLIIFCIASLLLLLWENLSNDIFDAQTGVDKNNKPHSIIALVKNTKIVNISAYTSLLLGLILTLIISLRSRQEVLILVLICTFIGYLYQGPPFRLGYKGLGEPLCWIAFGPLATAAALMAISPEGSSIPWGSALKLGSGPALATSLVLFCSHFHQINQDAAAGKKSPLVVLGTHRAATVLPWLVGLIFLLEVIPVLNGAWPVTSLICLLSLPSGVDLIKLIKRHHNQPELIKNSKFLALRFQSINGLFLSIGFSAPYFLLY